MNARQTLITDYYKPLYKQNIMGFFNRKYNRFIANGGFEGVFSSQAPIKKEGRQSLITDYYFTVPRTSQRLNAQTHITNYFHPVSKL